MQKMIQMMEKFIQYHGQKYIAPHKAGDEEEYMLQFKHDGGAARKAFQQIVKAIEQKDLPLKAQRTSNWMNQAQIARAYFYCFFRHPDDLLSQPGMALRLLQEGDLLGISWEVSVLERTRREDSLPQLHRALALPISAPTYYLAYQNGIETLYEGTETNRQYLREALAEQNIRKVLIKENIGYLTAFDSEEAFINAALIVFDRLYSYYLATKE
ncbi:ribonuclease P [Tuanshanicoccus lijuaniae]|uniref:HI_0552 family protein n=1 Tax=Aerococcaceae bacterium zg-1292 TaxID=2774330 RepID=UPI001936F5D2|nr:ribonuclease P [Aerococcaceae bacterium zg-1292]MBF6625339.1 ribonuclease P [Aerococcaceae bacterium zg-BR9]QQA37236.1 ribonuclease P [Aerococcaceae bacterium zg-1292]